MWLSDVIRLRINNYIIIDDFFPDGLADQLRLLALNFNKDDVYYDYASVNFEDGRKSLGNICEQYVVPKVSLAKMSSYIRSWAFVYDNVSRGVLPHADDSFINVNVWITPDECVADHNKNGLKIYKKECPKEINWEVYNTDNYWIKEFLKDSTYDTIPYKYNRAVVFRGNTFHSTDNVYMKPGDENKRINYTFMFK